MVLYGSPAILRLGLTRHHCQPGLYAASLHSPTFHPRWSPPSRRGWAAASYVAAAAVELLALPFLLLAAAKERNPKGAIVPDGGEPTGKKLGHSQVQVDVVTQVFEASDETTGSADAIVLREVVDAEVFVRLTVADDVVHGDEDR
jgi:hypothetical protein